MFRPTRKELSNKLREAKAAVQSQSVFLIDQGVIAAEAIELGYDIAAELLEILEELLDEVSYDDYAGAHPPRKSYKDDIQGLELFPFVADSQRLQCRVYFKFVLDQGSLWLVSLHKDRPLKEPP
ncbi:MAG: hypothetical protein K9K64_14795 [Desulfohalobiaceae bacterium]|nr:hypothetical protein [Desulfohalobiaceae bacterium]